MHEVVAKSQIPLHLEKLTAGATRLLWTVEEATMEMNEDIFLWLDFATNCTLV